MISASSCITALQDGYGKALVSGTLAPTHRDENLESGTANCDMRLIYQNPKGAILTWSRVDKLIACIRQLTGVCLNRRRFRAAVIRVAGSAQWIASNSVGVAICMATAEPAGAKPATPIPQMSLTKYSTCVILKWRS